MVGARVVLNQANTMITKNNVSVSMDTNSINMEENVLKLVRKIKYLLMACAHAFLDTLKCKVNVNNAGKTHPTIRLIKIVGATMATLITSIARRAS